MAQFKRGVTTEQDVLAALGRPTGETMSADGSQIWTYTYASVQARPATFIPIIGMFAGGADTRQTVAVLRFGSDGKLVDYMSSSNGVGSGSGFAAPPTPTAPGPKAQPRRE